MVKLKADSLLLCAATVMELQWFLDAEESAVLSASGLIRKETCLVALIGVGMPEAFALTAPRIRAIKPDKVLLVGIAGAYPDSGIGMGQLVRVESECYGDVGFELPESPGFKPLAATEWGKMHYRNPLPLSDVGMWFPNAMALRSAKGCTVNSCTGTHTTGLLRARLFQAQVESMEGAAVAQSALQEGVSVAEIRAISNIAGERDMRPENVSAACRQLGAFLKEVGL